MLPRYIKEGNLHYAWFTESLSDNFQATVFLLML